MKFKNYFYPAHGAPPTFARSYEFAETRKHQKV